MKRFALQALTMVALAAAAGGGTSGAGAAARPLRVAVINPPGLSFTGGRVEDPVLRGLRRAVKAFGVSGRAVTLGAREDHVAALSSLAAQKYDLVITGTQAHVYDIDVDGAPDANQALLDRILGLDWVAQQSRYIINSDANQQRIRVWSSTPLTPDQLNQLASDAGTKIVAITLC